MTLTNTDSQAMLLLTVHFGKRRKEDPPPLTLKEWNLFSRLLMETGFTPGDIFEGEAAEWLHGVNDPRVPRERILALLDRAAALALVSERWHRAGLWVLNRKEPEYPNRLKKRLKEKTPPVLFGSGNRKLLQTIGVAVVGSRNASPEDLDYTGQLAGKIAESGHSVVSGGARGIDEAAMLGALDVQGTVIGILAGNLLRTSLSQKYREGLRSGNLALVSPFHPESGFHVGNAMARNKYIYASADAAVVVHSGTSGGTWTGARECLRNLPVPLWVKPSEDTASGNQEIVRLGGHQLPENTESIRISDLFQVSGTVQELPLG